MKPSTLANVRQDFCKKTFRMKGFDIQWSDVVGLVQLPGRRVAKLELSDAGYASHYMKLIVSIVHKDSGAIDRKDFQIDDYLKTRADTRKEETRFYVWGDRGLSFGWYICEPKDMSELMAPIEAYIKAWE